MWQIDLSQIKERVLLVDDDLTLRILLKRYVNAFGLETDLAKNGIEATHLLDKHDYGVVITDMVMPEMDGMELIHHIRKFHPHCDVLVISGHTKLYSFTDLISAGAADFIGKPFAKDELQAKMQRIFRERCLIKDLHHAKAAAEVASQAKSDFIHTISHELRTPMNGILGFSSLLGDMEMEEQYATYTNMIRVSADRLMELVNQILNYTNLETSKQDLHPTTFTLEDLIGNLLTSFQSKLETKALDLQVEIAPDLPKQFSGDAKVLGLIIQNLLDNAIKCTEKGSIIISATCIEQNNTGLTLQLAISDSGCGISEKKHDLIFEAFGHAEPYKTRRQQGSGLGLTICSKLVKLMNGQIWMESKLGEGSTFTFTVKLGLGSRTQEAKVSKKDN